MPLEYTDEEINTMGELLNSIYSKITKLETELLFMREDYTKLSEIINKYMD